MLELSLRGWTGFTVTRIADPCIRTRTEQPLGPRGPGVAPVWCIIGR